jgi:hypothetical protein
MTIWLSTFAVGYLMIGWAFANFITEDEIDAAVLQAKERTKQWIDTQPEDKQEELKKQLNALLTNKMFPKIVIKTFSVFCWGIVAIFQIARSF